MARPKLIVPPLRWSKHLQKFVIYLNRKPVPMGKTRIEAERRYREFVASGAPKPPPKPAGPLVLREAMDIYLRHARGKYVGADLRRIERATTAACRWHAGTPAERFKAKALKDVRAGLLAESPVLTRRYINHLVTAIKTAFSWLAAEEMVPPDVLASLRTVRALAAGEGGAELSPVPPANPAAVESTLPYLPDPIGDMVRLQILIGCRPGELVRMKRCELTTSPAERVLLVGTSRTVAAVDVAGVPVWFYCPNRNKNLHRGKPRIIAIGPEAQEVLRPLLLKAGFIFTPDADAFGNRGRAMVRPGECYSTESYARAVHRAIDRVNRKRFKAGPLALVEPWSPLQLRHAAAESAANRIDAESAAAMLGHAASRRALDAYVQASILKAAEAAARVG